MDLNSVERHQINRQLCLNRNVILNPLYKQSQKKLNISNAFSQKNIHLVFHHKGQITARSETTFYQNGQTDQLQLDPLTTSAVPPYQLQLDPLTTRAVPTTGCPVFLGAKLFYERVCPSVANSPTLSLTFSCFPFKIKVIELTLCKKKIIFLLKICSHLMRFYFVTHSLSKSWGLALFIYWLIPREYNGKSYQNQNFCLVFYHRF